MSLSAGDYRPRDAKHAPRGFSRCGDTSRRWVAAAIVIVLGPTLGLAWELTASARRLFHKVILVVPLGG
jgi:hypothetical protein